MRGSHVKPVIFEATVESLEQFASNVIGILNFYGFHVSDLEETLDCIRELCESTNNTEIIDAMHGNKCAVCKKGNNV